MVVYVESNFLLELVYEQAEADAARELLELAVTDDVDLAAPAFAVAEVVTTIIGRGKDRKRIAGELSKELGQLRRSAGLRDAVLAIEEVPTQLEQIRSTQLDALEECGAQLLDRARVLDITNDVFRQAFTLQREFDLEPADSLILASIVADRSGGDEPGVFISRDRKGFAVPSVRARLREVDCSVVPSIVDGVAHVRSRITPG